MLLKMFLPIGILKWAYLVLKKDKKKAKQLRIKTFQGFIEDNFIHQL